MKTEKRKSFLINFMYFAVIFALSFVILKYGMSLISPFVIAFLVAWMLRGPIEWISIKFSVNRKAAAVLLVILFYSTIGVLLSLAVVRGVYSGRIFIGNLPEIYTRYVEPVLTDIFNGFEQSVMRLDDSFLAAFKELEGQFVQSAGQMVSNLSMEAMGSISGAASSLPGLFIKLLLMIISTFFIAADYDMLTGFCLAQLNDRTRDVFFQIKEYVIGTLFVCIRSYAMIMSITFLELAVGLTIIGIENSIAVAFLISVFDILPVLGTGGIMIPWMLLTMLQGKYTLALGLLLVYLFVTVVRNIIEPKIVGSQIGLHPVLTLISMTVGVQLFGVLGLFGFPIGLSLLRHLNDKGTVKLFKTGAGNV